MRLVWSLVWYARGSEAFAGEVDLAAMTPEAMRAIFDGSLEDPMVHVHPVAAAHTTRLGAFLPAAFRIELDRFDYFVECTRDDSSAAALTGSEIVETPFGPLSIHQLRIVRRVTLWEESAGEPRAWILELTLETEQRAPDLRAKLRFEGVSGLSLQDFGGGEARIVGFDIQDISDRGWEGIRLEVVDFEGDSLPCPAGLPGGGGRADLRRRSARSSRPQGAAPVSIPQYRTSSCSARCSRKVASPGAPAGAGAP